MANIETEVESPLEPFPVPHTPSAQIMTNDDFDLGYTAHSPEQPEASDWFKTPKFLTVIYNNYNSLPFYQPLITPYQTAESLASSVFFFPFNYVLMVCIYIVGWPMMTMMSVLQLQVKHINTPVTRALIPWAKIKTYLSANHPRWGWFIWWSVVVGYYAAMTPVFLVQALMCWIPVMFFDFFYLGVVGPPILNLVGNTFLAMVAWWVIVVIARSIYATYAFFWA